MRVMRGVGALGDVHCTENRYRPTSVGVGRVTVAVTVAHGTLRSTTRVSLILRGPVNATGITGS